MDKLRQYLHNADSRGALRTVTGEVRLFRRRGVADLVALLETEPQLLRGGVVADKIVGRGAAFLFIKGGVREVYAEVLSRDALALLQKAGITTDYTLLTPYILNRAGNDLCPVEKLTANIASADKAYDAIKRFIEDVKS